VDQLKAAGMTLEIQPGTAATKLEMNAREGSPFADLEVRKAMNMGIDTRAIVDNLFKGLAIPFEQVPGIGQEGFIEGYDPFPYDPEAARAVLSKVTEPIQLIATSQTTLPAEVIAEQLRGYGMNVTVQTVDSAALNQINVDGNFDLMYTETGYASGDFVGSFYTNKFQCSRLETGLIGTGFCNPELDKKVAAIRAETDPDKRAAELEEVTRTLSEDEVPWVTLYGMAEVMAMQPYVHGFVGSSAGQWFDLHKVSVDK
jgi:peptide/nickel transport system substrate-binding protein